MSHTPIPWSRTNASGFDNKDTTSEIFADFDLDGNVPTRMVVARAYGWSGFGPGNKERRWKEATANADLIIKCVNSHDKLVNALKAIHDEADHILKTEAYDKWGVVTQDSESIKSIVIDALDGLEESTSS